MFIHTWSRAYHCLVRQVADDRLKKQVEDIFSLRLFVLEKSGWQHIQMLTRADFCLFDMSRKFIHEHGLRCDDLWIWAYKSVLKHSKEFKLPIWSRYGKKKKTPKSLITTTTKIIQNQKLLWNTLECEGPEKATRGEWIGANQNSSRNFAYVSKSTQRRSLLTRSRPPSYNQAIGLRKWARNCNQDTERCY
jgi:hypothetical protein